MQVIATFFNILTDSHMPIDACNELVRVSYDNGIFVSIIRVDYHILLALRDSLLYSFPNDDSLISEPGSIYITSSYDVIVLPKKIFLTSYKSFNLFICLESFEYYFSIPIYCECFCNVQIICKCSKYSFYIFCCQLFIILLEL